MRLAVLAGLALCLLSLSVGAWAETRISVLYPDSAAALRKLYQAIADGIARGSDVRLQSRAVSDRDSAEDIKSWVQANQSQVAIVLGDVPPTLTRPLAASMPVIRGADALDNGQPGVSLASSPAQMFSRLRQIKPDVERVFAVYKPEATGWLIAAARTAARDQGLELIASPSEDIQQSGAAFSRFRGSRGRLVCAVGEVARDRPARARDLPLRARWL